jgi:hypothetical protein
MAVAVALGLTATSARAPNQIQPRFLRGFSLFGGARRSISSNDLPGRLYEGSGRRRPHLPR